MDTKKIYSFLCSFIKTVFSIIWNALKNLFLASPFTFIIAAVVLSVILIYYFRIGKQSSSSRKKKKSKLTQEQKNENRVRSLAESTRAMSPLQFFELRDNLMQTCKDFDAANFPGVYVLYNKSKNLYYVGQAKKIYTRVNNHFTGHGNGDVYADYKYGDRFTIRLLPLKGSGYKTLNELERYAIFAFHAYDNGYNKTKGNKS